MTTLVRWTPSTLHPPDDSRKQEILIRSLIKSDEFKLTRGQPIKVSAIDNGRGVFDVVDLSIAGDCVGRQQVTRPDNKA